MEEQSVRMTGKLTEGNSVPLKGKTVKSQKAEKIDKDWRGKDKGDDSRSNFDRSDIWEDFLPDHYDQ